MSRIEVTRTYLELADPGQLRASTEPKEPAHSQRVHDYPPCFARFLHTEVGRDHPWTDRADRIDERWHERFSEDGVTLCILYVAGAPAGFCELRAAADPSTEIALHAAPARDLHRGDVCEGQSVTGVGGESREQKAESREQ